MRAAAVAHELGGRKAGTGFVARCPAHDDTKPSLTLADGKNGDLVWRCQAGCTQDEVRDALGARGLLNGQGREQRPEFSIAGIGAPVHVWTYHDATGRELLKVARYETPSGKDIRPWRPDGAKWICKTLPAPRPLYGLDLLAQRPDVPVLVVEGEKCADAARTLLDRYVVITWPGGAKAAPKADWTPLRGRRVTIWPDADPAGHAAAKTIVGLLGSIAVSIAVLDVGERPAAWDCADAVAEGWSAEKLLAFVDQATLNVPALGRLEIPNVDTSPLLRSPKGTITACEFNARMLIRDAAQYNTLHFDDFLSRMRIDGRDWSDADDLEALCWLQSAHGVPGFRHGQARGAAQAVAYTRRRDSLREFVEALPKWDGTERIAFAFSDAWGAPDDMLTRAGSRNFFVALVARAMQPGAQVDTVWCFEGPQGSYKSSSMRELGREFHAEITAPIGTTDFMRELRGVWLAEMSELDSLRGREASTVKRLLSAPIDRFVEKYQAHATSYRRRAVAVATTNEAGYWQDSTGARRLIPVACGAIRVDLITANRLQWFAEALHLFRTGATWWEFPIGISEAQDARQQVDPWEDILRDFMAHGRRSGHDGQGRIAWPSGWIASAEITRDWLGLDASQQGPSSGRRLGAVMRRIGYKPKPNTMGNGRGWIPDTSTSTTGQVSDQVSDGTSL